MFYTNLKYSPLLQKVSQARKHELLTTDVCKKWSKKYEYEYSHKPSLYSSTYRCAQKKEWADLKIIQAKIQAKVLVHVLPLIPTGRLIPITQMAIEKPHHCQSHLLCIYPATQKNTYHSFIQQIIESPIEIYCHCIHF